MPSIQQKRGTAAALAATNPVITAGEIVVETDTLRLKIGDGSTAWNSLGYQAVTSSQVSDFASAARSSVGAYGKTLLFG